jgi:hypothetical protein
MAAELTNGQVLHEGFRYASPFTKLIALGWYDGPTNGLLRAGDRVWKFDRLDEIHNPDGLDLRIFALAPLPLSAWDQLVTAVGPYLTPEGPVSVPRWQFTTDAARQAADRATDNALSQAGPVEWIVAAENLMEELVASKQTTPHDVKNVTDWPSYLNLALRASTMP